MPSTPRLSTPERSTTSSPMAARSSGVAAVMTVRMIASSTGGFAPQRRRADEPDPVEDQRVAGEHVEEQHALQHLRHLRGDLQARLDRLAAKIGERDQKAGDQNAERVQPAEEGDDDGG